MVDTDKKCIPVEALVRLNNDVDLLEDKKDHDDRIPIMDKPEQLPRARFRPRSEGGHGNTRPGIERNHQYRIRCPPSEQEDDDRKEKQERDDERINGPKRAEPGLDYH